MTVRTIRTQSPPVTLRLVITHPKNQGLAAARNSGLDAARGDWIAYLDDDDEWFCRHLEVLLRAANTESLSAAISYAQMQRQNGGIEDYYCDEWDYADLLLRNQFPSCNIVHESTNLRFDERLERCEDWDMWVRLLNQWDYATTDTVTTLIHDTPGSMTNQGKEKFAAASCYIRDKHYKLIEQHGLVKHYEHLQEKDRRRAGDELSRYYNDNGDGK
jgi:glycosyltransferase involved in cell wall biosynthesis